LAAGQIEKARRYRPSGRETTQGASAGGIELYQMQKSQTK